MLESILDPKNNKSLSTKDRISIETFNLMRQNNGVNITISQVCKAAGITKSTFYYHYRSIDEVIETFSDIISQKLTIAMPSIFEQRTCVEQVLMAIKIVDQGVEDLGVAVAASRYIMHLREGDYPGFQVEAGWPLVCAILTKAIALGELPNDRSAEEVAESVFFIMRGINHTWCMQGGSFDFSNRVQEELRRYFSMLQASVQGSIRVSK